MNKRGQITVFIIIGILILFAFALVFFIYSSSVEKKEISARPVIEQVPTELNPLVLYVEDCIRQTAERGLIVLGENGGYINPDDHGVYSYEDPSDFDGVMISKNSDTKVPYWLYSRISNNENSISCDSLAPSLKREYNKDDSIESQLDKYINQELEICIDEFRQFKLQNFEIKEGDIDTTTTVTDTKITFFVEYPLDIKAGNFDASIDKFFTELDVPLKKIYDLAQELTAVQSEFAFIERDALNLMESFSSLESDKLPPMTDSTFEFGKINVWPAPKVEENIKSMLTSYVPMMQIHQSVNYYKYTVPQGELSDVKQRMYDNMVLDLNKPVPFKVKFDYLNWPVYFDVNDNSGVVMPQSVSISYAGFNFGMQRYKAVYDLSYPVLVTIEDPNALKNKGYSFAFALEANIRNNRETACGQDLTPPIQLFEESLMCNEDQMNSQNYTISVKDRYDGSELSEVQVVFSAGEESCFIAETASDLNTKLPIAYGGLLTFIKQDYVSTSVPVDTSEEGNTNIRVKMEQLDDVIVSVKKKKVAKCFAGICYPGSSFPSISAETGWIFKAHPSYELNNNEEAVVTLKRISDTDEEFTTGFSITGNEEKTIRIAPGIYEIDIQLILNEELKIPAEIRCQEIKKGIIGEKKDKECFLINETIFDVFPSGGLNFNTNETYWELKPNNLYKANKITFFAASNALNEVPENLRVIEDIQQMNKIETISKEHKAELSPRIE